MRERTFKAEWKRLRGIARSEGRDPYPPLADLPPLTAQERLRRARLPKSPPKPMGPVVAAAWERAITAGAAVEDSWASQHLLTLMR